IDQVNISVVGMSAVSAAVAPIADQYKKVFISDAALFGLTKDKKYIFQNFMPNFGQIPVQINSNKDWKKIAIVYINDDLGGTWSSGIKAKIDSSRKVELFPFDKAATDFKTDALKIKSYNPDVVVFVGYGPALNQVFADMALNQIKKPYLTYLSCTLPGVLTDKRFNLEGQYSYEYPPVKDGEMKNWVIGKGRELNTFYTLAFENTLLALNVAKESGNDAEKGLEILKNAKHDGLYGEINFGGKNYTNLDLAQTKIINSQCVPQL
ncbi:MAG: ABC transporter substrate-binding protein, partial [Candidatus Paceibacterota bacterium]